VSQTFDFVAQGARSLLSCGATAATVAARGAAQAGDD
jgi:hypothetical protein